MTSIRISSLVAAIAVAACTSENASPDRTSVPTTSDAGADADADAPEPDENDGRDREAASCFAACQNTAFSCQAKAADGKTTTSTADLYPEGNGCVGKLTTDDDEALDLKLDCIARTVCLGEAPGDPPTSCVDGTFSAFAFAYAPSSGGPTNVCTRN